MKTAPSYVARNLCLCFLLSSGFFFTACNQNQERIEEREQRDEAAKAAGAAEKDNAAQQDTVVME